MECSRRVAHVNDAKTTHYDVLLRGDRPLQKEQASTTLSASACKILTFLQDENIHRRLIVTV